MPADKRGRPNSLPFSVPKEPLVQHNSIAWLGENSNTLLPVRGNCYPPQQCSALLVGTTKRGSAVFWPKFGVLVCVEKDLCAPKVFVKAIASVFVCPSRHPGLLPVV